MPKGFYYLIASLPFLSFSEELKISPEVFCEEAQKWLSPKEYELLLTSTHIFEEDHKNDLVTRWKSFEGNLRKELKKIREKKAEGIAIGKPDKEIEDVLDEQDPLQREILLAKKQLSFLEELEQGHDFDLEAVIIYYLKLGILQRIKSFDKEKGQQVFEKLCEVQYE